ncbi:MAG: LLM class flavin-dependent oxidoreductase, partial [Ilumatobacteraceae bacterium]
MTTPTFGIFDHIEAIPGTPTPRLLRDRLDLVRMADQAGFTGYYLAEHHGSELCMAPNQEMFIAAASQITDTIRMGPMVKLLPLHHPVRLIEDMCVVDNLTNGRLEFGVGRGVAPIEHYWFGSDWPNSTDRFEDVLGIICRALRTGEISSEGSRFHDFRTMPMSTRPVQDHIPFWYPGSAATAGRFGLNLMWPGPIDQEAYDVYAQAWHDHAGDDIRMEAPGASPRVACTMVLSIAEDEKTAREVNERGLRGLMRRTTGVHRWDAEVLGDDAADAALGPLR